MYIKHAFYIILIIKRLFIICYFLTVKKLFVYRTYALRRVKDGFRENLHVDNPKTLDMLINQARENLAVIKRQASNASFV